MYIHEHDNGTTKTTHFLSDLGTLFIERPDRPGTFIKYPNSTLYAPFSVDEPTDPTKAAAPPNGYTRLTESSDKIRIYHPTEFYFITEVKRSFYYTEIFANTFNVIYHEIPDAAGGIWTIAETTHRDGISFEHSEVFCRDHNEHAQTEQERRAATLGPLYFKIWNCLKQKHGQTPESPGTLPEELTRPTELITAATPYNAPGIVLAPQD